jgi:hypothetical protein
LDPPFAGRPADPSEPDPLGDGLASGADAALSAVGAATRATAAAGSLCRSPLARPALMGTGLDPATGVRSARDAFVSGGVDRLAAGDGAVAGDGLGIAARGEGTAISGASKTAIAGEGGSTTEDEPPVGGAGAGFEAETFAWKLRSAMSLAPMAAPASAALAARGREAASGAGSCGIAFGASAGGVVSPAGSPFAIVVGVARGRDAARAALKKDEFGICVCGRSRGGDSVGVCAASPEEGFDFASPPGVESSTAAKARGSWDCESAPCAEWAECTASGA